jgi:DNA-binding NtrC family response regulator
VADERTIPQRAEFLPVASLAVEVIDGPNRGQKASGESLTLGSAQGNALLLTDPTVSRFHLELTRRDDGILAIDPGSTNGTFVGGARIERAVLPIGAIVRIGDTTVRVHEGSNVEVELHERDRLCGLRGQSARTRRLLARIERAAPSDTSVLIFGESGTGKELVAHALHSLSRRKDAPFVTVDCASLSPTLVASHLFGHERGAFTGADRQHVGAFEQAKGGTLFLDEIGELPADLQSTLLGVLDRRRLRRLGGRHEIPIDVRVVSATHRDLRAAVNGGTFRLDLYYRLAIITLEVPALRERADDIPLLVSHFARECGHAGSIEEFFPPPAMLRLMAHPWPGNVRELRNVVEATVTMGEAPLIAGAGEPGDPADPKAASMDIVDRVRSLPYKEARAALLLDFERRYIADLMAKSEGNVSRAARMAHMDRSHLTDLLQRHSLR